MSTTNEEEKSAVATITPPNLSGHGRFDDLNDSSDYVLGAHESDYRKTTQDGQIVLFPQPSDSPKDPLNWSQYKKHVVLFVVSATAFLPDFGSSIGAVALIPQAAQWGLTQDGVLRSQVGNLFMIGAGGVIVVGLMAFFGRLPILFWFTVFALWTAAFCAGANTFNEYLAARILNGFFSTVAQGGGLYFINDMFFVHEHARKINIWSFFIILSPYLGPLITAFIISKYPWPWAFWLLTLLTGICLIAITALGQETYYDRSIEPANQPLPKSRLYRLVGIEQFQTRQLRNSATEAAMRPIKALLKPTVFISTVYYLLIFAWVVGKRTSIIGYPSTNLLLGINTTLSIFLQPLYGFGPRQIGYFYFTPIIATVLGEICGHWLHDAVANLSIKFHNGHLEPEARLWVIWISTPFMVAGLVLLGFCLQDSYHFLITAFAWGLYVFGIMISTVGLNTYVLDSYPEASGEVAAWLNFSRTTGGFLVTYFQIRWASAVGPQASFSTQAGIVAGAFVLIIGLQIYGKRMRQWSGKLHFKTH